jgi:regulatory protein
MPAGEDLAARLAAALAREAARTDALRLLRARARAAQDLISRLVHKGHARADAAAAVERLGRAGLIDDEALARDRAERLAAGARLGPRAAQVKLRALGLGGGVSAEAVSDAFRGVDLLAQATEAARRRAASLRASVDEQTLRRRLFGYLARRGYDHDTCRQAVEQALGSAPED